jgi:hypothetical protein
MSVSSDEIIQYVMLTNYQVSKEKRNNGMGAYAGNGLNIVLAFIR